MGQKVNPHGLRVGVINDWDSRWYAKDKDVGDLIVEDHKIREYLKNTLYDAGIAKIEIERDSLNLRRYIIRPKQELMKGNEYYLKIPHRAFRDINGFYSDSTEVNSFLSAAP